MGSYSRCRGEVRIPESIGVDQAAHHCLLIRIVHEKSQGAEIVSGATRAGRRGEAGWCRTRESGAQAAVVRQVLSC
jgi:hypothetical protein